MRALIVTLVAMATVGCATQADRQRETTAQINRVWDKADKCLAKIKTNQDLQILNGKVEFGRASQQTLAHYTNTSTPTEEEKTAFLKYSDLRKKCRDQAVQETRGIGVSESYIRILDDAESKTQDLMASLYSGKITYGEYAKERKEIASQISSSSNELAEQGAREQQYRDQMASQQALQNFQNQQQLNLEYQRTNALNNATFYGRRNNPINCTTTSYGMTADTTCR